MNRSQTAIGDHRHDNVSQRLTWFMSLRGITQQFKAYSCKECCLWIAPKKNKPQQEREG